MDPRACRSLRGVQWTCPSANRGGYNGRFYDSQDRLFTDDAWHCVEALFRLNSLDRERDRPNADGVVRAWFDGRLVIERTDVVLRSTDFPHMKFNQLLLAPYFGPGLLPHAQTLWIDELALRQGLPPDHDAVRFLEGYAAGDGAGRDGWGRKLARHARVEALLQLAAYGDQLVAMGLPAPREVHLWLGDGSTSSHRFADLQPILADRSERLRALLDRPVAVPVWGDPELRACGWCDHCAAAEQASRDVLLVAGVRVDQRAKLAAVGVPRIELA